MLFFISFLSAGRPTNTPLEAPRRRQKEEEGIEVKKEEENENERYLMAEDREKKRWNSGRGRR